MRELFGGSEEQIDPFGEDDISETDESTEQVEQIETDGFVGTFGVGDAFYSPALSVLFATTLESDDDVLQVGDRRLSWWEESSVVPKHDFLLVNPLTWAQSNDVPEDMGEVVGYDQTEQFVFADSGGFQVKTFDDTCVVDSPDLHDFGEMHVMPEKLLEWQVKNATAGAILDFPPYVVDANSGGTEGVAGMAMEQWEEDVWVPNVEQSVENARRAASHREKIGVDDFLLYNVLHGMIPFGDQIAPDRYLTDWYDRIAHVGEFDGWCVGVDSGNLGKFAMFLSFISENIDESHLHFLGSSAIPARIVLEFWRVFNGDEYAITMDSTGFEVGSQYRSFFNPLIHGNDVMVSSRDTKDDDKVPVDADVTPCSCSVCAHMEKMFGPRWAWDNEQTAQEGVAMNMHNLNLLLSRHRMVQGLVQSHGENLVHEFREANSQVNKAWKVFEKLFSDELIREIYSCLKFILRSEESGYENVLDDFRLASKFDPDHDGPLIEEKTETGFMEW